MIDPKELRIGNLIYYPYQRSAPDEWVYGEAVICGIHENGVQFKKKNGGSSLVQSLDDLAPIPITPEWLERLGWHLSHHGYWEYFADIIGMTWDEETGFDAHFADTDIATGLPHIKYVHQLQNLIHALTGQELTIKQ